MPNTRKSIQIKDSYKIWNTRTMKAKIKSACWYKYVDSFGDRCLNRSYLSMYIEWWLHNIGYYLTRNIPLFKSIAERCKDVDLEERL